MSQGSTPPLKRHEALAPFSRDHYVGLVQAQRLMKAASGSDADRRGAVAAFLDAWDTEIGPHFADEERLLPGLMNEQERHRLLQEHGMIRGLAVQARELRREIDPDARIVDSLGRLLNDHIRWEERVAFQAIQATRSETELASLAEKTRVIEASRPRSACRHSDGPAPGEP